MLDSTWDAVDKLEGGPQSVELRTLVNVDHPVGGRLAVPHRVIQKSLNPGEDHLEDAEPAAQPLPCQQVALLRYQRLLGRPQLLNVRHDLQRCVPVTQLVVRVKRDLERVYLHLLGLQSLLLGLRLLTLLAEGAREDVLEGGGVQEVAHLLLGKRLLDQQTEQYRVS